MIRCKKYSILTAFCIMIMLLLESFSHIPSAKPSHIKTGENFDSGKLLQANVLPAFNVSASIYYPEVQQTDESPLITADGSRINKKQARKHRWIAISRDLLSRWGGPIQYGDSVIVKGISKELDGIYIVRDTMNKRFRNSIDILVNRKDKIFGRWNNVRIFHLNQSVAASGVSGS